MEENNQATMTLTATGSDRRKKSLRCLALVATFVVFQTGIIMLSVLLVLKIRDPKVHITSPKVENQNFSKSSFSMDLKARITVKNTNFGHFKFGNSTATISYLGTEIGETTTPKARAGARSTKRFDINVSISSSNVNRNGELLSDLSSGVLKLSSTVNLSGKIYLFKVYKKKKSAAMNCTMEVHTKTSAIENLRCK